MLIKIIDKNSEDYDKEFKVRRMNYEQIVVNYLNTIKVFSKSQAEFITENDVDKFLIQYSDFLKIKLNRGISISLYKALLETIEKQLQINFYNLNVLKDKYLINKRGIWQKEILAVINENIPINISATGQNFKKSGYDIMLNEIKKEEFLEICTFEIKKIEGEIEEKQQSLSRYGMAIEKINNPENPVKMLL